MPGRRSTIQIHLTDQTRSTLQSWLQRQKTPLGLAQRARGMLLLEQGYTSVQTAHWIGLTECHLRKWARRFLEQGISGLSEKSRPGRSAIFTAEVALLYSSFDPSRDGLMP